MQKYKYVNLEVHRLRLLLNPSTLILKPLWRPPSSYTQPRVRHPFPNPSGFPCALLSFYRTISVGLSHDLVNIKDQRRWLSPSSSSPALCATQRSPWASSVFEFSHPPVSIAARCARPFFLEWVNRGGRRIGRCIVHTNVGVYNVGPNACELHTKDHGEPLCS